MYFNETNVNDYWTLKEIAIAKKKSSPFMRKIIRLNSIETGVKFFKYCSNKNINLCPSNA